ncbi:MAG: hypothetical protein ACLR6B_13750 [Blautia sp.]
MFHYTKESVLQFLKNGWLEYLPHSLYTPLNPQERLLVLKRLLNRCTHPSKNIEYHLIKSNLLPIHPNAMIDAMSKSINFVGYYNNDDNFEAYRINEPNLSKWIYLFLESLPSSEWIYSQEEQIVFLEETIQDFRRNSFISEILLIKNLPLTKISKEEGFYFLNPRSFYVMLKCVIPINLTG